MDRAARAGRIAGPKHRQLVHYPVPVHVPPVHVPPAYRGRVALGPAGCRATEAAAGRVLSLPMFPELTDAQVHRVCSALRACGQLAE